MENLLINSNIFRDRQHGRREQQVDPTRNPDLSTAHLPPQGMSGTFT